MTVASRTMRNGTTFESVGATRVAETMDRREMPARLMVGLFWVNLIVVVALFASTENFSYYGSSAHVLSEAGSLFGLVASNLILVQLGLMSRNRTLDRTVGQQKLTAWHKVLGKVTFYALVLHIVFIVVGYAQTAGVGVISEVNTLVFETRDVLMATVAALFILLIVVTSVHAARRRMRHETWLFIHLYSYLAVALALPHQIFVGTHFAESPLSVAYWSALYVGVMASLVVFRIARPTYIYMRHGLHVQKVVRESPSSISIYVKGRDLKRLKAEAGQYFVWRFMAKGQWWQAHPYSLSSAPRDEWLRITVKNLGDGSRSLRCLRPGTRVIVEGPFGNMTPRQRRMRRVVLIGAGIGVTPIRALAESMSRRGGDMTIVYRASTVQELIFRDELQAIADRKGARLQFVVGARDEFDFTMQPLSSHHLRQVAPHIHSSDVYVCGPPQMVDEVTKSLRLLDVPASRVHVESF